MCAIEDINRRGPCSRYIASIYVYIVAGGPLLALFSCGQAERTPNFARMKLVIGPLSRASGSTHKPMSLIQPIHAVHSAHLGGKPGACAMRPRQADLSHDRSVGTLHADII